LQRDQNELHNQFRNEFTRENNKERIETLENGRKASGNSEEPLSHAEIMRRKNFEPSGENSVVPNNKFIAQKQIINPTPSFQQKNELQDNKPFIYPASTPTNFNSNNPPSQELPIFNRNPGEVPQFQPPIIQNPTSPPQDMALVISFLFLVSFILILTD
jgi:hypothetical protein